MDPQGYVIPAQAGIQLRLGFYLLDCHFRGNDIQGPSPANLRLAGLSTARGEAALLDCRLRGNDTLGLARQKRGKLVHSANVFQNKKKKKRSGPVSRVLSPRLEMRAPASPNRAMAGS